MAVIKLSKNDVVTNGSNKIKLNKNQVFYDSSLVSTWETSAKKSQSTLSDYGKKISEKKYLTTDDLKAYKSAMDSYLDNSNRLRTLGKILGTAYDEKSEKDWTDYTSNLTRGYDDLSKFYSQFDSEDSYNSWYENYKAKQDIMTLDDFEEYSKKGASIKNPTYDEAQGWLQVGSWRPFGEDIGNIVTFSRDNMDAIKKRLALSNSSGDAADVLGDYRYQYLDDDDVAIYNYYLGKGDKKKADEYLASIENKLNQEWGADIAENISGNPLAEVFFAAGAGIDQWTSGIRNLDNFVKGTEGDAISPTQYASSQVRSDIKNKVWGGVYDLTQTTGNMLPSILVGSVTGGLGGAVTMGAGVAGNAYSEMRSLGYDEWQSRGYATLVGASEAALSYALGGISKLGGKVSGNVVSKLASSVDNAIARTAITLGGNMASEFAEEAIQEVLDPIFKGIMTGEKIEWSSVEDVLYSGLLGALSAGLLEGAPTIAGTAINSKAAQNEYGGNVQGLINQAVQFDPDNAHAQRMQTRLDEGRDISGYQLSRLAEAVQEGKNKVYEEAIVKDREAVKSAIKNRLEQLGESTDVESLAEAFTKKKLGEKLGLREETLIANSDFGQRILNETNDQEGAYSSAWVQKLNEDRANISLEEYKRLINADTKADEKSDDTISVEEYSKLVENSRTTKESGVASESRNLTQGKQIPSEATNVTNDQNIVADANETATQSTEPNNDGKTIITATSEEVTPVKIVSTDGGIKVELDGGKVVEASKLTFGTSSVADVYDMVELMGVSVDTANALVNKFKNVSEIKSNDVALAYQYGKIGNKAGLGEVNLTEAQKQYVYNLGRADAQAEVDKNQSKKEKITSIGAINSNNNASNGKKKGKLHNTITPTSERQRTSLKALGVVANALGIDIYTFESPVVDGKRQGANGWYDPKDQSIHIDLHAGFNGEGTMLFTAAHELTHFIRDNSPAKFKVFADFLIEQYGKKGVSVGTLINEQIKKAERNGRTISDDTAYEEVIADACEAMLADGDVIAKIAELKAKDKTLWQTIKDFFTNLISRIKAAYEGLKPDSVEAQHVAEMLDAAEKLKALWTDALVDASEASALVEIDTKTGSASPSFSERTWTASEYVTEREETAKKISKVLGVDIKTAYKYIDDINGVARLIADDRARLDYEPNLDDNATVLKSNKEYKYSVDMSTLCAKRLIFTGTFDAIQKALPNTAFDSEDIVTLREMMQKRNYEVACGICYVESKRREIGRITQEFIDRYKLSQETGQPISRINSSGKEVILKSEGKTFLADKNYTPNLGELNTTDIDIVKRDHPKVYDAYLAFMNSRGQAKPKLLETRAEYKGEILKHFKAKSSVEARNNAGGLRLQSFSDFEVPHMIDMMQVVMDMSRVGLKSQAYTKVPAFAEIFGDTGVKINLSLIAKGDGLDANGKLIFDDVEGINHKEAFKLRDKYSKNVGTILVGKTDAHIIAAMADSRIDYIIPFHKSFWKESLYEALGLTGYADYTEFQNEKPINKDRTIKNFDPSEYWDFTKSGDENAQIYLEKCREDGRMPKFPQFQGYPGYWKLLIDFKMYDNNGVGSPQEVVKPAFNTEASERILNEYKGGHRSFPVAKDVVEDFVKAHKDKVKYSDRDSNYITSGSKAVMTQARIDYLIEDSGAGSRKDYAQAWITSISPTDYLNLTTSERIQDRNVFDTFGSEWDENVNNTNYDYLGQLKKSVRQTPYLAIDINTGEVVGHDGRHRIRALEKEGIKSVEIKVEFRDEDGYIVKYSPNGERFETIKDLKLINQFGTNQSATIHNVIPLNEDHRSEIQSAYGEQTATESDIRYSDRDSTYMDAVNRGDTETAQRMVNKAALEWGAITNGNARVPKPLHLYHGTGTFGFTRFRDGSIFATTSESVAAGYNRGNGLGRVRSSSIKYIPNDGTSETAIKNAKNVLGATLTKLDDAAKQNIISKADNILKDIANKVSELDEVTDYGKASEFFDYLTEKYGEDKAVKWTNDLDSLHYMLASEYTVEEILEDGNWLARDLERYHDWKQSLSELWSEEREAIKESTLDKVFRYLLGYEYGDALIDIEFGLGRLLNDRQKLVNPNGSLIYLDDVIDSVEMVKDTGIYDLYGHPGEKPLIIDEGKRFWDAIPFENGFRSTDYIVKWAKEHGYTSVLFKTVLDPSSGGSANVYADEWVFFNPNQVKSADPITYDDNGNVIPLSERFKSDNPDIRYSFRDSKSGTANDALSPYNEELTRFIQQKGDYIVDSFEKLEQIVNLAFDDPQHKATAYFGIINVETLEKIKNNIPNLPKASKDILFKVGRDYSVATTLDSVRHIVDDKSLTRDDVIDYLDRFADTILEFDSVAFNYYVKGNDKIPGLLFKKNYSDGTLISFDLVSNKKRSVVLQTLYMDRADYQKKKSAKTLLMQNAVSNTSETQVGQTPEGSIPYSDNYVKRDFSDREKYSLRDVEPITEAEYEEIENHFGTTGNFRVAGYLLTDGKLLDFSGKHWGDTTSRTRQVDHRDVEEVLNRGNNGFDGMVDMIGSGNIRLMPEIGGINLAVYPNEKQRKVLSLYINYMLNTEGEVTIDYDTVGGDTIYSKSYGKTATSRQVLTDIRNYFNGGRQSDLMSFHTMYSERGAGSVSNRYLLANALESVAQNDIEKNKLAKYKEKIALIEAEQTKLAEVSAKLRELSFAKGKRDQNAIDDLKAEKNKIANRINIYDSQLLKLEATTALKGVLERATEMARKKEAQKGREAISEYKESIQKRAIRAKIKNFKTRMESMLQRPTDTQYVPMGLASAIIDVCELINTDTDLYKKDGTINRAQEKRELTKSKLRDLKDEYEKLKKHPDPMYSGEFDEMVYEYLTDLQDYGDRNLNEMTIGELQDMYEMLRAIDETLADARKLIGFGDAIGVYEAGDAITAEQNEITKTKRKDGQRNAAQKARDKSLNYTLSPVRNVERMSGYNEDSFLLKLFKRFEKGIRKKNMFVMESYKLFDSLTTGKNAKVYEDAVYTEYGGKKFTDVNGRKFGISKMQMMQTILSYEREKANKMNHIQGSGFSFADLDMLRKGKLSDAISEEYSHRIPSAGAMVEGFIEALKNDKWAQEYMAVARRFFNEKAKDAVNKASLALKHRIIAKDKNYIPFEVDKNFIVREISAQNDVQQTINSYGMLKETKAGASQPLIITGLNNVLDRHIDQVGNVHGLAIEVRNFNKVWSVRSVDTQGNDPTVKAAIQRNWGVEGVNHIEQAVQDIQGSRATNQSAAYRKIKSNYIGATFLLNLSVVTKQIGSLFTSVSMLRYRGPVRMLGNLAYTMANYKKISAEVDKYTATAWMRRQGVSDAELQTLMTEGKKSFVGKIFSKLPTIINPTKWIAGMDSAVALSLWRYAKQDTAKKTGLKGEELLKATAEFYDEVVENTQSMTDVLHRPEVQKEGGLISDALGMFKTDLYQMSGQLQATAGRFAANKSKENAKALGRTAYSIVMSATWAQLMTTVFALLRYKVNQYRDDEDEELTMESWLKRQSFSFVGDIFGYVFPLAGSEFVGIIENVMYGESEDVADNIVLTAVNDFFDVAVGIASSLKDGEMLSASDTQKLLTKALQMFGVPANNILRLIEAIQLHAEDIANGEFMSFEAGVERNTSHHAHRIAETMASGKNDVAKGLYEEAIEELAQRKATKDDREVTDDDIEEAKSSLKTAIGKDFKDGELDHDTVEEILVELFEMSEDEARAKVDFWAFRRDHPKAYEELTEASYTKYMKECEPHGVTLDTFYAAYMYRKEINADEELTAKQKERKIRDYIYQMNISASHKRKLISYWY